jgi:hypothetical protein
MLLKRRSQPTEADPPAEPSPGFEHLDRGALATLRWLKDNRVEFVLTGAMAEAVHSHSPRDGHVAIVPAPYTRNLERLARALSEPQDTEVTVESLTSAKVRTLSCGSHTVDVQGTGAPAASGSWGASGYQELLYEAHRFELSPGLTVEVASPEDIEHYAHLRRTGTAPEIKISRQSDRAGTDSGPAPTTARGPDSLPGSG